MSLQTRLGALITAVGADIKDLRSTRYTKAESDTRYAVRNEVPSLEETAMGILLAWPGQIAGSGTTATGSPLAREGTDTPLRSAPLLTLPFPYTVLSFEMLCQGAVAASETAYWEFQLQRTHETEATVNMANMFTSQASSQGGWTARRVWSPALVFDPVNRICSPKHSVYLTARPVGGPAALAAPTTVFLRYSRV